MTSATLSTNLRIYAVKRWPLDKDERRKERLASLLNMTKRRVRSLWQNESTARPRGDEIERIEALICAKEDDANEADSALAERISALEAQIAFLVSALARDEVARKSPASHPDSSRSHSRSPSVPGRRASDQRG